MTESSMTHRSGRRAALLSLATCLLGCSTVGVGIPRSGVDVPTSWQGEVGSLRVESGWWAVFGDPVLTRLIERALARNLDVRIAASRVAEAQALSDVQQGARWPTLEANAGAGRSRSISDASGVPYVSAQHQLQFQATYELDVWGRLKSLDRAAQAIHLSTQATRDAVSLSVAATTASAYLNLRALDDRLQLAQRTLIARDGARRVAVSRERAGYASSLEVAQAEAEYRATAQAVPLLVQTLRRQEHAIQLLVGATPGVVQRGADLLSIAEPALADAGLPSELVRRRPDISGAEQQLIASDEQLAAARGQLLPSVRLSAAFGRVGSTALDQDPFSVWTLGASVLAPIFSGGRLRAQVDAAAARRDQALAQYERVVLTAFSEVEDQLSVIAQTREQVRESEAQRDALENALRIARSRYRAGYASYLEELDAQRALFNAEQNAVQLRADLLVAHVNLYRALGGGWVQ